MYGHPAVEIFERYSTQKLTCSLSDCIWLPQTLSEIGWNQPQNRSERGESVDEVLERNTCLGHMDVSEGTMESGHERNRLRGLILRSSTVIF